MSADRPKNFGTPFTAANARAMQAKGRAAREAKERELKELREFKAQIEAEKAMSHALSIDVERDTYLREQRDKLRACIAKLHGLMTEGTDAQELDRLASAWSKLAPLEAQMDRRPNLAPIKSTAAKPAKPRGTASEPIYGE